MIKNSLLFNLVFLVFLMLSATTVFAQGLTTASMNGLVVDADGVALPGANVIAVHVPTGTQYGASTRDNGQFNILNMRIGGPYTVTVSFVGYERQVQENISLNIGQTLRQDFTLSIQTVELGQVVVTAEEDDVLNSNRTGAATYISPESITALPSVKRSTRDITRLDPRSDGNFSFGGRNWLYNNISVDGSYFNNPFGLDDPSPGGQTGAEPIPYDAVEQVQVSIAPFDVREGGFTGAGINTVTKSGTNQYKASIYSYFRNESLIGSKVSGEDILVPDLSFNQTGFTASGPIIQNKLFLFLGYETVGRDDPGSGSFVADTDNNPNNNPAGVSRVTVAEMDAIRAKMQGLGFDPGLYQGFTHQTKNQKILAKIDWNVNETNNLSLRFNYLDAEQQKPPHPFAISYGNTGRGPNQTSMPFQNSGYTMNNELTSIALELNSRFEKSSNKFFVSYNIFRDFRNNTSRAYPTIEIGEGGVTYTTLGHEPFSIHNILDQDVLQVTDNFSYYLDNHVLTGGVNFEYFKFFNSFNLFRYGFMGFNAWEPITYGSVDDFLNAPVTSDTFEYYATPETVPYKGEFIEVSQLSLYAQDEWLVNEALSLTYGLRVDIPMYITDPVDNQWSRDLALLDENEKAETVDQSRMPDSSPLFSPRIGFNWDVNGDRSTQLRGGTGIFTGRLPFVWVGNNISNPGFNPNLYPVINPSLGPPQTPDQVDPSQIHETKDNSVLAQSSDLNAMASDFKWPQVWTTDFAWDQQLPGGWLTTLEVIYSKDINAIYVRNANLGPAVRTLGDGRPYYNGGQNDPALFGGGAYVIDNTDDGYNFSVTAQFRKQFESGLYTSLSYTYLEAKNVMASTEIASVLWQSNPTAGYSNRPELGWSQFGLKHRIVGGLTHKHAWNDFTSTTVGVFLEVAQGNSFAGAGGNRYSFTVAGDVNGDGMSGNDLMYIPDNQSDIILIDYVDGNGNTVTAAEQWTAFNSFIEQDSYLSNNRGSIAERFALVNPWYWNMDVRVMQDFNLIAGGTKHTFQLSVDILNFGNLLSSSWGVRQVANSAVTNPVALAGWTENGEPQYNYRVGLGETFQDDPSIFSRWQMQIGVRYMFN